MKNNKKRAIALKLVMAMTLSCFAGFGPQVSIAKNDKNAVKKVAETQLADIAPCVTCPPDESNCAPDPNYDPNVTSYDAYDKRDCETIYTYEKMKIDVADAKVTDDCDAEGIRIKATADAIEKGEISFAQEFDFSAAKPGFVVVNGLSERKKPAKVSVYLDNDSSPVGSISIPKQRGKDKWDFSKNYSADISSKNITGKHKVKLKISYSGLSADEKKKKTELLIRSVLFTAFDIPTVSVNIDESEGTIAEMNNDERHQTECYGNVTIQSPSGYVSEYGAGDTSGTYEMEYIRGRGNSTWGPRKKPYKIKLDKKADLFGMGANKHWVMLANYFDYTMLRNKYTYWLGDQLGMEFTPQCIFVNFVMNGEYLGSYYLCEHVRVGKSRVDVDDLEEEPEATSGSAVTGGYLLSMGSDTEGKGFFTTEKGQTLLIESPDFSEVEYNQAQSEYISGYVQSFEDALFGSGFKDKTGKSYADYMDVKSAVDYYLIQEFSLNGDGFLSNSTYLYKKRDDKLFWGPLWDFDYVAWGATEFGQNQVEGFMQSGQVWYNRMLKDKSFKNKLVARWKELKTILLDSVADGGELDKLAKQCYMSQKANYAVTSTVGIDESSVGSSCDTGDGPVSYDSEVARLKRWISERVSWVDANINKSMDTASHTVTFKVGKKVYKKVKVMQDYMTDEDYPKAPKKKGYSFRGWYVKVEGGQETDLSSAAILKNTTAYARFSKVDKVKGGSKIFFLKKEMYIPSEGGCDGNSILFGSYPENVTADMIKWSSSNKKVRVTDGMLAYENGLKATATITAKYKKCKIKCKVHIVPWEKLDSVHYATLSKKKITMKKGTYKVLKINYYPKNSYTYGFMDSFMISQNEKVVEVDSNGVLHALKKGKSMIVVNASGKYMFCQVTVK